MKLATLVPELPSAIVTSLIEMLPTTGVLLLPPEIAKLLALTTAPFCRVASAMPAAAPEPSGSHITEPVVLL